MKTTLDNHAIASHALIFWYGGICTDVPDSETAILCLYSMNAYTNVYPSPNIGHVWSTNMSTIRDDPSVSWTVNSWQNSTIQTYLCQTVIPRLVILCFFQLCPAHCAWYPTNAKVFSRILLSNNYLVIRKTIFLLLRKVQFIRALEKASAVPYVTWPPSCQVVWRRKLWYFWSMDSSRHLLLWNMSIIEH